MENARIEQRTSQSGIVIRRSQLGDVRLEYCLSGPRSGIPVVLLHVLGTNLRQFVPQHYFFRERRRTLSVSLRGHGGTTGPANATAETYRLDRLALDVTRLLKLLSLGPVHLVGGDLGALVALEILRARPQAVTSLALWSAPPFRQPGPVTRWSRRAWRQLLGRRWLKGQLRRQAPAKTMVGRRASAMVDDIHPDALHHLLAHLQRYDYRDVLTRHRRPLQWYRTPRDQREPAAQRWLLDAMYDGRLFRRVVVARSGRLLNLEASMRFAVSLQTFLAEVEEHRAR